MSSKRQHFPSLLMIFVLSQVLWLSLPGCSVDVEEEFSEIEKTISRGDKKEALEMIESLQKHLMLENGFILDDTRRARLFAVALNGSTVAWGDSNRITYRAAGAEGYEYQNQLTTDFRVQNLYVNSRGTHILASAPGEAEGSCEITAYSLENPGAPFRGTLNACRSQPALNETGNQLFFMDKEGLKSLPVEYNPNGSEVAIEARLVAASGHFKEKYSRLKNRFRLLDYPDRNMLLFYGAAGYYRLYNYDEIADSVHSLGDDFAKPQLIVQAERLLPEQNEEGEILLRETPGQIESFVYRGTPGKYKLYALRPGKRAKLGDSFNANPMNHPVYIRDLDLFMTIRDGHLSLVLPARGEPVDSFPIQARSFLVFREGLLYETEDYRLILRRRPLNAFESRLAELAEKLRIQLEKEGSGDKNE